MLNPREPARDHQGGGGVRRHGLVLLHAVGDQLERLSVALEAVGEEVQLAVVLAAGLDDVVVLELLEVVPDGVVPQVERLAEPAGVPWSVIDGPDESPPVLPPPACRPADAGVLSASRFGSVGSPDVGL